MRQRKLVLPKLILELRRRAVFRAAAVYIVGAWLLVEVASLVLEAFAAPAWIVRGLVLLVVATFPLAMLVSWRFDLTRSGFVRTLGSLTDPDATDDEDARLPDGISGAERRTMSVLICRLDQQHSRPSDIAGQLDAQRRVISEKIAKFGGHMEKGAPDEALVYFGYPTAHEDNARRAVRAALEILSAYATGDDAVTVPHDIAVAIHTGVVVVGRSEAHAATPIVGPTVDIARALHEIAEPGTALVSDATWSRAKGYFDGRALPVEQEIGGIDGVYQVLARTGVRNRLDLGDWRDLTPIAGRDRELASLQASWQEAAEGMGQVVLISGEPGIGKSRLIEAVRHAISARDDPTVIVGYCSAYRTGSALFPFVSLLTRTITELDSDLPDDRRLAALRDFLGQHDLDDEEDFCLLANLVGLTAPNAQILERMSPPMRMQRTAAALLAALLAHAGDRPLLLIVEDLHWADPSSLAMLALVVDHAATSPLLVLLSFRRGFTPDWASRSHVTTMQIGRLPQTDTRALLNTIPGAASLPDAVAEAVVRKTDGVPLFVEEVVKIVLDKRAASGVEIGPEAVDVIPDTLQELLTARLDQLGKAKVIAQLGAMLGREFGYAVLATVAGLDSDTLHALLRQLIDAEMLFQKGVPPRSRYLFKHALIQDAAYHSLLRKDRIANHLRIARLLEERFPELAELQPETLARHFAAGGEPASAARHYLAAGTGALQKSAAAEAAEHVRTGLDQIAKLPAGADRDRLELGLRMTQGPALMATLGFADARTGEVYERAQALSGSLQDVATLVPALFGRWIHHGARGELAVSLELAQQILGVAQQADDPDLLLEGNLVVGCSSFHMGDVATCRRHFERILESYRPDKHAHHAYVFGQDPMVAGAAYLASALWCFGEPGPAAASGKPAIARAREIEHPYTLALALVFVARVHQMNRDPAAVAELAGEVLQVTEEYGFPTWQGFGLILLGWARAHQGDVDAGLSMAEQGLELCRAIQLGVSRAYFLSLGAEIRSLAGDPAGALAWLDAAETELATHGVQIEQPQIHRARAAVEQSRGDATEARRALATGVSVAAEMATPAWEVLCLCDRIALQLCDDAAADCRRVQQLLTDLPDDGDWYVRRYADTTLADATATSPPR